MIEWYVTLYSYLSSHHDVAETFSLLLYVLFIAGLLYCVRQEWFIRSVYPWQVDSHPDLLVDLMITLTFPCYCRSHTRQTRRQRNWSSIHWPTQLIESPLWLKIFLAKQRCSVLIIAVGSDSLVSQNVSLCRIRMFCSPWFMRSGRAVELQVESPGSREDGVCIALIWKLWIW
jgi:hypothetical protein